MIKYMYVLLIAGIISTKLYCSVAAHKQQTSDAYVTELKKIMVSTVSRTIMDGTEEQNETYHAQLDHYDKEYPTVAITCTKNYKTNTITCSFLRCVSQNLATWYVPISIDPRYYNAMVYIWNQQMAIAKHKKIK